MLDQLRKYQSKTDSQYDLSILIPSWNNLDYLKYCIRFIQKNSTQKIQVIIAINEGIDGTTEWVAQQQWIDYIHFPTNYGICYTMNLCRSMVQSDLIVYLNDDMLVLPQWDTEILKTVGSLPTKMYYLSGTMIEPTDTGNPCAIVQDFGNEPKMLQEDNLLKFHQQLQKQDWNGASWPPSIMHKDCWDLVGGFSVEFSPGFYSDPDLSKKLYDAGVRIFKGIGACRVYHFGSKSTKRIQKTKGKNTGRSLFISKWGMSANFFYKKVLLMGQHYSVLKQNFEISFFDKVKLIISKLF